MKKIIKFSEAKFKDVPEDLFNSEDVETMRVFDLPQNLGACHLVVTLLDIIRFEPNTHIVLNFKNAGFQTQGTIHSFFGEDNWLRIAWALEHPIHCINFDKITRTFIEMAETSLLGN